MSAIKKNLGGDRLGSGAKMNVELHNYSRSTHDLSSIWRSTMAPGTLVPFIKKLALPGDNFEINLNSAVMTYPTVGPLFASFKLQLDVFLCPIRLYQGKLHNNALGIGMNMAQVKLPQLRVEVNNLNIEEASKPTGVPLEFQQFNQSSIFAYLGMRGVGKSKKTGQYASVTREFNAIPYLAYWDIYKNYYANKQEEIGAVIHNINEEKKIDLVTVKVMHTSDSGTNYTLVEQENWKTNPDINFGNNAIMHINGQGIFKLEDFEIFSKTEKKWYNTSELFDNVTFNHGGYEFSGLKKPNFLATYYRKSETYEVPYEGIRVKTFKLSNIDDMRNDLLMDAKKTIPYVINNKTYEPYGLPLKKNINNEISAKQALEGLAVKTYQSDIYNNWLSTEWLENEQGTGINQITAVSTNGDSFQIDSLIMAKKVYDMLNRIAVSGGSYDDWLEAVWAHQGYRRAESPIYMGGLSREVVFQEVVSKSSTGDEPLGSLAGKGTLSDKKKGGYIEIKVDEPSFIIGIVSLTPRIDYSQGNDWDVNLKTMDDFHKPALDGIGFQELITDQMAFWDSTISDDGTSINFKSAGKQPAWINYMTDVNKSYGNFADSRSEMFMTLNRRYEYDENNPTDYSIKDLTTYIDPAKFNYMFAVTDRSAQNFWVQIATDMIVRRKMSAKIIPNL